MPAEELFRKSEQSTQGANLVHVVRYRSRASELTSVCVCVYVVDVELARPCRFLFKLCMLVSLCVFNYIYVVYSCCSVLFVATVCVV